jgi:glycosyltransferase involved in cell wall biosynthesis
VEVISPPVELPEINQEAVDTFGSRCNPEGRRPVIGMAARLASEKGVEVLLQALPRILERHPNTLVLFAGQHLDVLGEGEYRRRLSPTLDSLQQEGRWRFLGVLSPTEMAAFYPNLDLLVVPSLNSTESFGLVQIEAMMNGIPVVASDLPGVRQPVRVTGMGLVAEVGSAASLAAAILRILDAPADFMGNPREVASSFSPDASARGYESLFERLMELRS